MFHLMEVFARWHDASQYDQNGRLPYILLQYKPINLQAKNLYAVLNNSDDIPPRRTGQKAYEEQTMVFMLPICGWTRLTETYPGVFQMPRRHISGVSAAAAIKTPPLKYSQII